MEQLVVNESMKAVFEFEAKLSLYAVTTLSFAIDEARLFLPDKPPMSVIWAKVGERMGERTGTAIARCLDRSMTHIFESGSRRVLAFYQESWLHKKPAAHDFIYIVAAKLYGGETLMTDQNSTTICEKALVNQESL